MLAARLLLPAALLSLAAGAGAAPTTSDPALKRHLEVAVAAKRAGNPSVAVKGFRAMLGRLDELKAGADSRVPVWNDLALMLAQLGELEEARTLQEKVLAAAEASTGEESDGRLAVSLHNLGQTLLELRRQSEAAGFFAREAEAWGRALGVDHPNVARALDCRAWAEILEGRHDVAGPALEAARVIYRKTGEGVSEDQAWNTTLRARVHHLQGRFEQADALFRQALGASQAFGQELPATRQFYAELLRARGQHSEAKEILAGVRRARGQANSEAGTE